LASGYGILRGRVMTVMGECRLTVSFKGRSMRIEEGAGCNDWHGATCTFEGTLTKTK
jgi:hypothetical protein